MPFIAKVTREQGTPGVVLPEVVSTFAVATLDGREVYNALYETPIRDKLSAAELIEALPKSGGIITLPDGMTVQVEPVEWVAIAEASGLSVDERWAMLGRLGGKPEQEILAAFNVKFAAGSPSTTEGT